MVLKPGAPVVYFNVVALLCVGHGS
jgi:hypothetical protein